jgi:hypothetical protein
MDIHEAIIAIAIAAAGIGITWYNQHTNRAEQRRQKEQDKIEKGKEKRENESPFGRTVAV